MLDRASEMAVFVQVVEAGSFSAAARTIELTPSAVSKLVTRLESRLGVRLFQRSTRHLGLTVEGELYYHRCKKIIEDIEETELTVSKSVIEPCGKIRVNSSVPFATHQIVPYIPEFLERYSGIEFELSLTDNVIDLLEERVDVAIRIGAIQNPSFMMQKLAESRLVVVASPHYLQQHGVPKKPEDLLDQNCLRFNLNSTLNEWAFLQDGKTRTLSVKGNLQANNGETLRQLALAGLGIARLATFMIYADIQQQRLVPILEHCSSREIQEIHAVFFSYSCQSARLQCFLNFLIEKMRAIAHWESTDRPW